MQQHDRRLRQPFDVLGVLRAMVASKESHAGPMHYVGLCTTTTLGHAGKMRTKHQIDIEPHCQIYPALDSSLKSVGNESCCKPGSLRFVPLLQWYDSTHLCCTKHYRDFVFGRRNGKRLVAKGGFIEDKLSQQQLAEVSIASRSARRALPWQRNGCSFRSVAAVVADTSGRHRGKSRLGHVPT